MKKDTQSKPDVRKPTSDAVTASIGEPRTAQPREGMTASPSATVSARYIDSRLKQFCLR